MEIIVWTKTPCVQCGAVKRKLKSAGVEFEERDLLAHPEQVERFKMVNLMQAPIVQATGFNAFSGFQPDNVAAIIAAAKA